LADDERRRPGAAACIASQAEGLCVDVVQTREGFDAIAAQWEALEEQSAGALLFQSSGWARAIFDFEAERGNLRFAPVIATLSDAGRLVAVLPLELVRTPARKVLAPIGHAFGQYSDLLIAPDQEPRGAVARLLRAAIAAAPCDGVSFLKVRADSALARGMPANQLVTGEDLGTPYVALDAFPDFASYFQTVRHKTRKNLRNARNRLEREGAVTHEVSRGGEDARQVIERTLAGRAGRLRQQGLSSRAFGDGAFAHFCASLPDRTDISLLAMSLRRGGEALAEQWGFVHRGRYYAFVASRDFSQSEDSPGKLHLGEVIRTCAEEGLGGVDLMVPAMPYKLTWATEVVTVSDHALPVTPRGLVVIKLWDQRLRPMLKRAMLGAPRVLRSLVLEITRRSP
jgi:CelD/BcsL family acetyltransferase involved in cellulose biosynthesis